MKVSDVGGIWFQILVPQTEKAHCFPNWVHVLATKATLVVEERSWRHIVITHIVAYCYYYLAYQMHTLCVQSNPIQSNPMSITEAGQRPLFPSLSKNLKYKTQINSN